VIGMRKDNDGRFPDESDVLVRYPLQPGPERQPGQSDEEHLAALRADSETWPWLACTVAQQCGPDEWLITVEDRRLAELQDGSPAPGLTGRRPRVCSVPSPTRRCPVRTC